MSRPATKKGSFSQIAVGKILVPVEGSMPSRRTVNFAVDLANAMGTELTFIHVVQMRDMPVLIAEAENGILEEEGQRILGAAVRAASARGVAAKAVLKKGHVVDQILRFARIYKPDLIVMGSRGMSKVKGILLGSVSQDISRHAKCSVLIVR